MREVELGLIPSAFASFKRKNLWSEWRIFWQFWGFKIRRTTSLSNRTFADLLSWRLQNLVGRAQCSPRPREHAWRMAEWDKYRAGPELVDTFLLFITHWKINLFTLVFNSKKLKARPIVWYQNQSHNFSINGDIVNFPEQCKFVRADFVLSVLPRKFEMAITLQLIKLAKF